MRKSISFLVVASLLILSILPVYATDFEGNENYYIEKCKVNPLPKADVDVCSEFNQYLKNKTAGISDRLKEIEDTLATIEDDIVKIQDTITSLNNQINEQNNQISYLEERIVVLEASIEEKDQLIRERMYATQGLNNSNVYLTTLMGATTFKEFFSILSAISEITNFDYELMESLEADKVDVEESKQLLETQKQELEDLLELKEEAEALLLKQRAEYHEEWERQYEQSEQFKSDMEDIQDAIDAGSLNYPPSSSGSWGQPVASGTVTAVGWNYPDLGGGKVHTGMDIGAPVGTPLYAPANGVVIYMYTGCPTLGNGYGDSCAGGMGNNIVMIVQVDGTTYAVKYYHMQKTNAIGWSSGNFITVSKGDLVGYVGHSGSSTGAHVHIEVINLGSMSYSEAASLYAQKGGSFGLSTGTGALSYRCSIISWPCRETASDIFGYSLRQLLH